MLYQSIGSSTCAAAALGNLLFLYGIECDHQASRNRLFRAGVKRPPTVTHEMILEAVRVCFAQNSPRWHKYAKFSFERIRTNLATRVDAGAPALLTFHMRHVSRDWHGVHCVVVVAVDQVGIHVIDALGRRNGRWPNATILPDEGSIGWPVKGAPLIVTRRPAYILEGLLQLVASTYYYRLYARSLQIAEPRPRFVRRFLAAGSWSPAFWWTGIVWATAAVGLHNIQQLGSAPRLDPNWPGQLKLSDDPLAYLGVLVDIIQEWDRYSVFKSLDREPIQGTEVDLGVDHGKVIVYFKEPNADKRAEKMRKDLSQALDGWNALLEVTS